MEDFFDVGDPATVSQPPSTPDAVQEPPADQAAQLQQAVPPTPAPAPSDTPPAPQLPEWFAEIPEAERGAVIASALASMPIEQRAQLAPVAELMGHVRNLTAAQVQNQQTEVQREAERNSLLLAQANEFLTELTDWAPAGVDLRAKADQLTTTAQRVYHDAMANNIEQGLLRGLGRVGLGPNNLPQTLVAAVGNARDYGEVIRAYVDAAADAGFELGRVRARADTGQTSAADATAAKARAKNEALGELSKAGRIRIAQDADGYFAQLLNQTPASLDGTPAGSGTEIDDAEFAEAVADADAYERLMKDPVKAAAFHKLMAGGMAG